MVSFLVKNCDDCDQLQNLICSLDGVLAQYGKQGWQNFSYLTHKPVPYLKIKRVLYYREILENLRWNQCFYENFSMVQIVSGAKTLLGGDYVITKRRKLPTFTTSTTTTTTTT
jgi:hypothetical protein